MRGTNCRVLYWLVMLDAISRRSIVSFYSSSHSSSLGRTHVQASAQKDLRFFVDPRWRLGYSVVELLRDQQQQEQPEPRVRRWKETCNGRRRSRGKVVAVDFVGFFQRRHGSAHCPTHDQLTPLRRGRSTLFLFLSALV